MMDPFQEANTPTMDNDLFYFFTSFINSFLLILSQNQKSNIYIQMQQQRQQQYHGLYNINSTSGYVIPFFKQI